MQEIIIIETTDRNIIMGLEVIKLFFNLSREHSSVGSTMHYYMQ